MNINRFKQLFFIAFALFCFFNPVDKAYAQLIIKQVYPNPLTNEQEWIEIFYPHTYINEINLSEWTLWDQLSSQSLIYSFENQTIEPGECLSLSINNKLNNSADGIFLKDAQDNTVDQMSYDYSQPGKSWLRSCLEENKFEISQNNNCSTILEFCPTLTTTPIPSPFVSPTSSLTPTIYQQLQLSEIMACPEEGSEWIEIFNPHNVSISLNGWKIWDEQNMIFLFDNQLIQAQSFSTIEIYNKLNNSGDQINLYNPNNEKMDSFEFKNCKKGTSYIFHLGTWYETDQQSKNQTNIFTPQPSTATVSSKINQALNKNVNNNEKEVNNSHQKKPSKKTDSSVLPTINLSSLKLETAVVALSDMKNYNILFDPKQVSKKAILSVIIGGILLSITGIYSFYEQYKKQYTPKLH